MKDVPAGGIVRCVCVKVEGSTTGLAATLHLYASNGAHVGETRLAGFSEETVSLLTQLRESIEGDFVEFLGGSAQPSEASPFDIQLPPENGPRSFGPNS